MKKLLIAVIAILGLSYASASNFSVTASYLGGNAFAVGAQVGVDVSNVGDLTLDITTNTTDVDVLFGLRHRFVTRDSGDQLYATFRTGVGNPVSDFFSAPDSYTFGLGLGGINEGNLIEAGVYTKTSDFSTFGFGFALSAGFGVSW